MIGYDETGFAGRDDATYRRQAWNFMLSGGGLFNHLDYSFTVGKEDGTDVDNRAPGGGSPALRRQLKVLSDFLHSFRLEEMNADLTVVKSSPGLVARALSSPGKAYAVYFEGRPAGPLRLDLPPATWSVQWINPVDGTVISRSQLSNAEWGPPLDVPKFDGSAALRIVREKD